MAALIVAAVLFVATHLGISSTPLRGVLVAKLGEKPYLGVYSLVAFATIIFLVKAYLAAPRMDYLWAPSRELYWVAFVLMPVAFVFMLGGFMAQRRNPTSIGGEAGATQQPSGLLRITRHPFQWSVVIWAVVHVIVNGDLASVLFFGALGSLSLAGTFLIDRKKARQLGQDWATFAATTSNVPFAAIAGGRNVFRPAELWPALVVGGVVFALVLFFHRYLSGVALMT